MLHMRDLDYLPPVSSLGFQSSLAHRSDFIALEIYDGHLKLVLDKGNGPIGLNRYSTS